MERLDVRVDPKHRRQLAKIAETRGVSISAAIRMMIEESYEAVLQQRRIEAAERIGQRQIEQMPDPDTLSEQLASTYDTPLP